MLYARVYACMHVMYQRPMYLYYGACVLEGSLVRGCSCMRAQRTQLYTAQICCMGATVQQTYNTETSETSLQNDSCVLGQLDPID